MKLATFRDPDLDVHELEPHRDGDGFLDLLCTVSVNGTEVGRDRLSNVGWTFETMIAYASRDSRVVAGDVFSSGTAGNGGYLAELWGRRDSAARAAARGAPR
ncbi:MAG TPA: fumarylacetoacetate hydrolase family protein [Nocardioides sp.]